MSELSSAHYDDRYFDWQAPQGEFGGWANLSKFRDHISGDRQVLDFGCGGGFLLKNIKCSRRVGVEVNPTAVAVARQNGIEVFTRVADVPDEYVDVIISNSALEHTLQPLEELRLLHGNYSRGAR